MRADITPSGDVDPADYSWWTGGGSSATNAYIGKTASGSLTVNLSSDLSSYLGYIGDEAGSTGEVTVDGSGSTWTNSGGLTVGTWGQGMLNITNGGAVSNTAGYIGYMAGSTGVVTVDGAGSTWTNSSNLYVGYYGQGTLNITNGGAVSNTDYGYIGYRGESTGVVTVDGAGSTWACDSDLYVGGDNYSSDVTGELNITNGGAVNVTRDTWVARNDGAAGEIHFESGTLTTRSLFAGATQLAGTGTINTHGLVSDMDLLFDSAHGLNQTLTLNSQPDQNITINLTQDSTGYLGAGYAGEGTLAIRDGVSVESCGGYIGCKSGSTGVVTVDGSGSTWTNSGLLRVGEDGQGTLNITNGGAVSNTRGYIGGSSGVVTVDGIGSTWACESLSVGHGGQGTLNITNGGSVNVTGDTWVAQYGSAVGEIHFDNTTLTTGSLCAVATQLTGTGTINTHGLVSDVDLLFDSAHGLNQTLTFNSQPDQNITINLTQDNTGALGAGYAGEGTLTIRDGVSVESSTGYIGCKAGATGVVTVDGSGSTWTCDAHLYVGRSYGHGTLNITNGGSVSSNGGFIGYWSGCTGVVTVDGSGSTWNSYGLVVGHYGGQGTLNITNGGAVSSNGGFIGFNSGSHGTVTVDGSGSTWTNSGDLYVGFNFIPPGETGELNITNGGAVSNSTGYIGNYAMSTGVVTVDGSGSTWTNSGGLYVGSGGTGELTVRNGGSVDVGNTLKIWGGGTLNMGATGQVTVGQALVLAQDSTLTADAGATIHMTGSAFQNESSNSANLAGLGNLTMIFEGGSGVVDPFEAGGEDMGAVVGGFVTTNFLLDTLQLGGVAAGRIQLVDDFDNQDDGATGDEAVYVNNLIMNAGATIDLTGLNLYYFNGSDPKQFFCGDATLDGGVDVGDLGVLAGNYGLVGGQTWATGDFTGDGNVDVGDLGILAGNYGESIQTTTIPEPATLTLLGLGALPLLRKRSR